jgi:putative transposase
MKKEAIVPNEFYHTYNRGVEKRNIFLDDKDYIRGVHDIYEFNDENAVSNFKYRLDRLSQTEISRDLYRDRISIDERQKQRKILVDLMCWCLMPNHYHFFSRSKIKDGLSKFHQKFGIGFTGYINLKYKRNGVLFQGKYKRVRVINDSQASHLVCYIHSNPLELWKPDWKEKKLTALELQNALKFLEKYRWSSHLDYLGIKNFPSLISTEFLLKFFKGPENYKKFFIDWLKQYEENIPFIQKIIIQ